MTNAMKNYNRELEKGISHHWVKQKHCNKHKN